MPALKWLPGALDDLHRLYDFIAPHSPDAAARAITAIIDAAQTIQEHPEKGRPWEAERAFRELPVAFGAKGYVIRYRLYDGQIIIVRVWHGLENR